MSYKIPGVTEFNAVLQISFIVCQNVHKVSIDN